MRIVRYQDALDATAIDLSTRLTVVRGLSADARERFLAAMAAIPAGTDPGATGSIEVHGVFLDLNRESLELLELADPFDVVVDADDLPRAEDLVEQESGASAPDRERLGEAEVARRDAMAALERVEASRIELFGRLSALADQRREISADIDVARGGVDSAALAELVRAREALESLRRRSAAALLEELAERRGSLEGQLEGLITEADQQRRELKRLSARGTAMVRDALDSAVAALDRSPSPEALAIADELESLDAALLRLEADGAGGRSQLDDLTVRRDAAYDELVRAESGLRSPQLDEAAVEELESVHDEIFELDGRGARLSSSRLRRRMNALRERERELLDLLGFDTWSAFVMRVSTAGADAERRQRYAVAKATYELAEDELARATVAPLEVVGEIADRQDERRRLLGRAEELLGKRVSEDAVVEALRSPGAEDGGDADRQVAAVDRLRDELLSRGAISPPEDPDLLFEFARRWLADEDLAAAARIRAAEASRLHIEGEITRLAAELSELPDPDSVEVSTPSPSPRLSEAEAALAQAEQRVERHRQSQKLLDELRGLDAVLRVDEERLEVELHACDAEVNDAEQLEASASEAYRRLASEIERGQGASGVPDRRGSVGSRRQAVLDRVEWYLLSRFAQQRSVSFVGSVPIVIDDAFVHWSIEELSGILERLVRMSEVIQVIILTDDAQLVGWARDLGREVASVVDLRALS